MIRFNCDYSEGAHSSILEKLAQTNLEQTAGYGLDPYCEKARKLIQDLCKAPQAQVHFLVGGTQTNMMLIAAALRPYQGALSPDSGHINVHESGAIEATGHKVLALPSKDGKITAQQVKEEYTKHYKDPDREHMVQPKLVYISNPTEIGTIYSKAELTALSKVCRENNLYLYVDGARLGYGLTAKSNDLSLEDMAELCDAFYIGGTKVGALFGEALVITNPALQEDFRYVIKQHGGMFAKGRLLGIQFLALLEDGTYFNIARHANELAEKIKQACIEKGYSFLTQSDTNQQFPILPNSFLEKLGSKYTYSVWQPMDETHSAVRFCTSWATKEEDVASLIKDL